jgi:hypothetical protein
LQFLGTRGYTNAEIQTQVPVEDGVQYSIQAGGTDS